MARTLWYAWSFIGPAMAAEGPAKARSIEERPAETDAKDWTKFLYMRDNSKGIYAERWRHSHGCGRFFNALRDTTTDHFVATYKVGERP